MIDLDREIGLALDGYKDGGGSKEFFVRHIRGIILDIKVATLEKILKSGHGGGNWRRLIEQSMPVDGENKSELPNP
jgi:hypothetical protein